MRDTAAWQDGNIQPDSRTFNATDGGGGFNQDVPGVSEDDSTQLAAVTVSSTATVFLTSLLEEAGSDQQQQFAILRRFGKTEDGTFQTLPADSQRLLVEAAVGLREAGMLTEMRRAATYDFDAHLESMLHEALAAGSFGSVRWLVREKLCDPDTGFWTALGPRATSVAAEGTLDSKYSVAEFLQEAGISKLPAIPAGLGRTLIDIALSADATGLACELAGTTGLTITEFCNEYVAKLLDAGRPEAAFQVAQECGTTLEFSEIAGALSRCRLLQHSADANGIERIQSNLELFAANQLTIDRLPGVLKTRAPCDYAAFVLLEFRGGTFGSMASEGGHAAARLYFQERLVEMGFTGRPRVMGGTLLVFADSQALITVKGKSGTYGPCDLEQAKELLSVSYPEATVRIDSSF